MAYILPGTHADHGWMCPGCQRGYSPRVDECPHCPQPPEPVVFTPDGLVPVGDAARSLLQLELPPEMGNPDYTRILRASSEWREILPGLECRAGPWPAEPDGIRVELRLRTVPFKAAQW